MKMRAWRTWAFGGVVGVGVTLGVTLAVTVLIGAGLTRTEAFSVHHKTQQQKKKRTSNSFAVAFSASTIIRSHGSSPRFVLQSSQEELFDSDTEIGWNTSLNPDSGVIMPEGGAGSPCVIKVLGVGGGGGNAVNRMIQTRIEGVSFWAMNTDAQALRTSLAPNTLNIGRSVTRGLGAGGDPGMGKKAALENAEEVKAVCMGADMVFITAGMGGGTGSGAAPVVAEIAKKECGCLTVGVVTKPFRFEGRQRMKQAEAAIAELRKHVDTLIVVSNDKLLRIVPDNTPVTDAFLVADDILRQGVVGISEIIIKTGLVNVDFADIRAVMKDAGTALMGVGTGVGKSRAADAAVAAISSPLLDFPISQAKRIVFNVVGGPTMGLTEINSASEVIYENAHIDANIIFGALIDPKMGDEVSITVLACDFREEDTDLETIESGMSSKSGQSGSASNNDSPSLSSSSGSGSGNNKERDVNFYKERRQMTRSPLGPDATLEETRVAITRGFKKPPQYDDNSDDNYGGGGDNGDNENKKKGGFRGFFRRMVGRT
uniref:Cell division protein FtsZ n=1 Tax=Attheya septentrionalis TaxID=420275 RepID=A0A7S2XJI3_9STRA|mmetsp:Transcript_13468/g.24382  ORF Transcript_13468/g.24382 Transcript_13468/m.24382 type:complete len:543 (+) Transcript_13468:201-1829(+)|eukprot:CAMPEP_0198282924 /NCGR_PEP_ID=MMETSP1449-20131203/2630_1 /TAXON_ID=420275 /ORGANISM="Attheya septentrionalis, Strain CCMP2084" /LENGTH=542 /DNA_ID=CAMNT_0043979343 /DNA_START=137 /DNA_END=1765 /DNA_ORIENTATION=-